jgi:hypothetical protein
MHRREMDHGVAQWLMASKGKHSASLWLELGEVQGVVLVRFLLTPYPISPNLVMLQESSFPA